MDRLKMHSPYIAQEQVEKIREVFPACIVETKDSAGKTTLSVDFERLKSELGATTTEVGQERYQLNWPGKADSIALSNTPITKTLRPQLAESEAFETTRNLFIEGDNLDALKLIQDSYLGRIKLIYADPPYNTGNDFIYKDDFTSTQTDQEVAAGERSDDGNKLVANPEGNGRFHSDWLTMIAPRLRLARNLLTRDGAIFVSCDEGEQPRLRMLMDEIFGQTNFVADMVWAAGRKNDSRLVSVSHEYIVCYAKDAEFLKEQKVIWRQRKKGLDEIYSQFQKVKRANGTDYAAMTGAMKKWYRDLADGHPSKAHKHYHNVDQVGLYFAADISWPGGGGPKYTVLHPQTQKPVKQPARGWMTPDPKKMESWIEQDKVHFGEDESSVPCIKKYLSDSELQTPYSVFYQDGRAASKRLRALMGGDLFDFPKDELVLQEIVEMLTDDDDIVLDFFAGSATTAHSVMMQNAKDGGNRQFIMVQLDEKVAPKSAAEKAGYTFIPEVSRERIRRAGHQILDNACNASWNQDIGFRFLKVDETNMQDVYYTPDQTDQASLLDGVDNIKAGRTAEDLLFQVLTDWGVDLTLPISSETILGKQVFFVDGNALTACFDTGVTEELVTELAKCEPLRVVFRDNGFDSDTVKINVEQIFKQLSPTTDVKAI